MKNKENIMKETSWLINMMSDDMNIHDFYVLKHYVITRIDKSKRAKRKRLPVTDSLSCAVMRYNLSTCLLMSLGL